MTKSRGVPRHASAFLAAYGRQTKGYPIHSVGSDDDRNEFSWGWCDTCGSRFGGARTKCQLVKPGVDKDGKRHEAIDVSSCDDCVQFAANGTLPDDWRLKP